ncbi:MAG: FecR domain-containing protein [Terriglobales bacterium]
MHVWRKALMFVLAAALLAWADSFVRIVRISDVSGAVQVSRPEPGQTALHRWTSATLNAPIVEHEAVRTLAGGEAEIQLECGSALRLTPSSEFSFPRLRLRNDGVHWTQVAMDSGTAFFTVQKADAREFQVEVAGSEIATPDGAANFRVDAPADAAVRIQLLNGHARVHAAGNWLTLSKSATLELPPHGASIFVANAAQDQWTRWSRERDQAYQRALMAGQPQPTVNGAQSAPPAVPTAVVPQVNLDNPGEVFKEIDAGALSSDPFFANKSKPLRVPNCHNN